MRVKQSKSKKKAFDVVGVRFSNNPSQIWHYKTRKGATHLGQELIVENDKGTSAVIVVQINVTTEKEMSGRLGIELKWIRRRVAPL